MCLVKYKIKFYYFLEISFIIQILKNYYLNIYIYFF